jgi:tetratricopeptide (TPR) repeat protein
MVRAGLLKLPFEEFFRGKERTMPRRRKDTEEHEEEMIGLGVTITVLAAQRGLERKELARRARVKPDTISAWKHGGSSPGPARFNRLAAALDVSSPALAALTDLFGTVPVLLGAHGMGGAETAAGAARTAVLLAHAEEAVFAKPRSTSRGAGLMEPAPRAEDRKQAPELWERLQKYKTRAERQAVVREAEAFWVWPFCELLCDESLRAAPASAGLALELARLGLVVACLARGAKAWLASLRRHAWAHLGNALRVCGQLPAADDAFRRAAELAKVAACGDAAGLLNEARVLGLEASLRRAQRLLPLALDLLDRALAADNGDLTPHLLINRAKTLEEMGDYEEAVVTLRQVIPLIDGERDPQRLWNVRFNLLVTLTEAGHASEAEPLAVGVRELAKRLGNALDLVRHGWLDAKIAAGLGRLAEAEAGFERVRKEFLARGIAYNTALVSLELAVLLLEQGRTTEVQRIAAELLPMFEAQQVTREALATVKLFCDAARKERITAEMARAWMRELRGAGVP